MSSNENLLSLRHPPCWVGPWPPTVSCGAWTALCPGRCSPRTLRRFHPRPCWRSRKETAAWSPTPFPGTHSWNTCILPLVRIWEGEKRSVMLALCASAASLIPPWRCRFHSNFHFRKMEWKTSTKCWNIKQSTYLAQLPAVNNDTSW